MKFSIKREVLINGLNIVNATLPIKTPSPALTGILMQLEEQKLVLITSTGETSTKTSVNVETVFEGGTLLAPGKMFINVVKTLAAEIIMISVEDGVINISADRGKYSLRQMDVNSFPNVVFETDHENSVSFKITNETLNDLIKSVSSSVSTNEKKPILTGVNLKYDNGYVVATATDTFRLSQKKIQAEGVEASKDFNVTIPMASVNAILTSTKPEEELTFSLLQCKLFMQCNSMSFVSVLFDGNYPDTTRLTLLEFANVYEFTKIDLLNAIDRAIVLSPNDSAKDREITYNVITVASVDKENVKLRVVNGMVGEANELVAYTPIQGENFEFAVNGKYFADAIKSLNGDKIKINLNSSQTPFTVSSENDPNNYQLLLPVRV